MEIVASARRLLALKDLQDYDLKLFRYSFSSENLKILVVFSFSKNLYFSFLKEAPQTIIKAAKSRLSDSFATASHARSKRKRAIDEKIHAVFNPTVLEDLLNLMMRHRDGWPFDRPITKSEAPVSFLFRKRLCDKK